MISVPQNAHEFSELPVRHNEDQVNSELAVKLPLSVDPHTYDSSNTKTHLLLQAHFSRVALPSADYHTDTKSVMDQVLRVLQVFLHVSLLITFQHYFETKSFSLSVVSQPLKNLLHFLTFSCFYLNLYMVPKQSVSQEVFSARPVTSHASLVVWKSTKYSSYKSRPARATDCLKCSFKRTREKF